MVRWVKHADHVGDGREEKDQEETILEVSAKEEANILDALAYWALKWGSVH